MLTLAAGRYLGDSVARLSIRGLSLSLTAYPPGREYPWHVHEHPTLFVSLAAQHRDETRAASFDQPPLSAVFHPAAAPHATATGPGGLAGVNLELPDAWLDRVGLRPQDLGGDCRLLDAPWARLLGLRLAAALAGAEDLAAAAAETVALELASGLVGAPEPAARGPRWLPRALEFLEASSRLAVGLREVAAEVGVHPVYFARAFRKATGRTVTEHLRRLRLLDAGRRILDGGASIAAAAAAAGFADQAHFTRTCSRALSVTPGGLHRLRRTIRPERRSSNRSRRDAEGP